MTDRSFEASPRGYARLAGALYLVVIVGGYFAEMGVRQRLVVAGNAAATADNILAHAELFRLGFSAELVGCLCNVVLAVIFYELFRVVSRRVALLVVFFSLVGTGIEALDLVSHFQPLILLTSGRQLGVDPALLQAQAYMALRLQSVGFAIALTFFGGYCLSMGYLIFRSTFLPHAIGVLLAIEGACYLANSFADFLAPRLASAVFAFLMVSALAEVAFCLWLLAVGVNADRWREAAAAWRVVGAA